MTRYITWRFGSYGDAVLALTRLCVECICSQGIGQEQDIGHDLEEGDITIHRDGSHACLTWSTPHTPKDGEWMSPYVFEDIPTYDQQGKRLGGEADAWGVREP